MQNRGTRYWLPTSIMLTDRVVGIVLAWGWETSNSSELIPQRL